MSEDKFPRDPEPGRDQKPGHPENIQGDWEYAIPHRPEPQTLDDLANTVDPVRQTELNRQSTRQAWAWVIGIPVTTAILAVLLAVVFRLIGGPLCEAGEGTWLCSRNAQIWWPIITSIVPVVGVLGCAVIMVRKIRQYTRWWPWMAAFWCLVPFSMLWMTSTLPIAITGGDFF